MTLETGNPLPGATPPLPPGGFILPNRGEGFSMLLAVPQPSREEVREMKRGRLTLGVYVVDSQEGEPTPTAHVLVEAGRRGRPGHLQLDASLNALDARLGVPEVGEGQHLTVPLILCESATAVIRALRTVTLAHEAATALRANLQRQRETYRTMDAAVSAIARVERTTPFLTMLGRAKNRGHISSHR